MKDLTMQDLIWLKLALEYYYQEKPDMRMDTFSKTFTKVNTAFEQELNKQTEL